MPGPRLSPRIAAAAACCLLCVPAGADTRIRIEPGPLVITEEEQAIASDPEAGTEHVVTLIRETQLNDDYGADSELQFHLRAKILSGEARDLANVGIALTERQKLTRWWGRTLLPDGRVLELEEKDLVEQHIASAGRFKRSELRGALPGVVPGAVIDYGYTVKGDVFYWSQRVTLQERWPVRRFRFRWKPLRSQTAAFRVYRSEGLDVSVTRDGQSVLVVGNDLPAVPEEPYMPPEHQVRASVVLYYLKHGDSLKNYWKEHARRIRNSTDTRSPGDLARKALVAPEVASQPDLPGKLRAAYDWLAANVENPLYEGHDAATLENASGNEGTVSALDRLYLEMARGLGAETHVVLAPDRRRRLLDPRLLSLEQFETDLIAVRQPGDPDEQAIIVDPDSGLPYGEVPWWFSGAQAALVTSSGIRPVLVPSSGASSNISRVRGEIALFAEDSILLAAWTRTDDGQAAFSAAQTLAGLSDARREEYLDAACGAGPDTDVIQVDDQVLHPPVRHQVACETETLLVGLRDDVGRYRLGWTGPWVDVLPVLPPGRRTHAIVFDYPRVETLELRILPPEGLRPTGAPVTTERSSPYGKYRLAIAVTPEAYTIQRALALFPVFVPAEEYDALREFLEAVRRADDTTLEFARAAEAE